jgi:hypothetical protein
MATPYTDIVNNYSRLGSELLERWSRHASGIAARYDADKYDADAAAADFASTARLATETGFLLASEAIESAAILAAGQSERHIVDSGLFSTKLAGATLTLEAPLVAGRGETLPVAAISIRPSATLAAADTEFSLQADATGCRAATYVGSVTATKDGEPETVDVWITVP